MRGHRRHRSVLLEAEATNGNRPSASPADLAELLIAELKRLPERRFEAGAPAEPASPPALPASPDPVPEG